MYDSILAGLANATLSARENHGVTDLTSNLTASDIRELQISGFIHIAAFTLLIYDYCLTLRPEVERFWRRGKISLVVVLFFLNRYFVPLGSVPSAFHNFWYSHAGNKQKICHQLRMYHHFYSTAVQVIISALLIIRTHALYEQSRRVLALLITVVLSTSAVAGWSIALNAPREAEHSLDYFWDRGCASPIRRAEALRYAKAWGGLLVLDTLIFILTLYKSLLLRARCGSTLRLLALMLRDGSVYYGVMVISNVANILTLVYGGQFVVSSTSAIVNSLSSVMITRLMLNMRNPSLNTVSLHATPMTAIGFHTPGNLSTLVDTDIDERISRTIAG